MWYRTIETKKGVNYHVLKASLKMAAEICRSVYENKGYSFKITSTVEGVHKKGSLHYLGLAFDCRTRHISKDALPDIVEDIKRRLDFIDENFQVVTEKTHIHIEYHKPEFDQP